MTNLEWLKTLNAEEMAEDMRKRNKEICYETPNDLCTHRCDECMLKWLKREHTPEYVIKIFDVWDAGKLIASYEGNTKQDCLEWIKHNGYDVDRGNVYISAMRKGKEMPVREKLIWLGRMEKNYREY